MSLQLLTITDPRDNLQKARRRELVAFANQNGLHNITEEWPADLIRRELRRKNLTQIRVNAPKLGAPPARPGSSVAPSAPMPAPGEQVPEIDADDDLARQFLSNKPQPKARPLDERTRLMRECKVKGIKTVRTDNVATLKAKLGGKNAA